MFNPLSKFLLIASVFFVLHSISFAQIIYNKNLVHLIYLSPSDVAYRSLYESVLQDSITDIQSWFSLQLDGKSFSVAPDPVSWFQLPNTTSFYETKPGGAYDNLRFWNSILTDANSIVSYSFYDPNDVYLFYVDADPLPQQIIGGVGGVAMMAANDLRGLSGLELVPINPGDQDIWTNYPSGPDRWIGGLGHELGHAFGLDHPGNLFGGTIMQYGYLYYPDTTLADYQKDILIASPFISSDYTTAIPEATSSTLLLVGLVFFALGPKILGGAGKNARC